MVKRLFDVLCAAVALVISAPLIGIAAIGIKLTDPGPVFFRARRVGYLGREFTMFKLRTMRQTTEGVNGPLITGRRDPRVYPLGQLLRRMKIDELPQLFNVLRGQMSLVGPRPLPQRDYDRLEDWHRKRNLVLPGITGLWQVSGRSELDFDELVRLDFLYLERWSVFLDLTILLKTLPAVARAKGAW